MQSKFKDDLSDVKKNLRNLNGDLSKIVDKYPWPSVVGAAAVGFGVAFLGVKKISALAMENKDILNDVLLSELGLDLNKILDLKKPSTATMPASAIGA